MANRDNSIVEEKIFIETIIPLNMTIYNDIVRSMQFLFGYAKLCCLKIERFV